MAAMQPASGVLATRGRGRGPWKKDGQTEVGDLRRPHTVHQLPENKPGPEPNTPVPPPDPGAKGDSNIPRISTLSVDAKEFVPKCFNVEQFEEAGGGGDAYADTYPLPDHLSENFLSDIIHDLSLNPGHFDNSSVHLTNLLLQDINDSDSINRVINMIVEQSIIHPNFRYNGARLLSCFRDSLPEQAHQKSFRTLLLKRCENENTALMENVQENMLRMQGFALFLAELYIQMNVNPGENLRIDILGVALFDVMNSLLSCETCENIKSVCQILKLAGLALDEQDTKTMDTFIERMSVLQQTYDKENIVHLIKSVITLRQNGWRQPTVLPNAPAPCTIGNEPAAFRGNISTIQDLPAYYLPNGDVLSAEQSRFIHDNIPIEEYEEYSDGEISEHSPTMSNLEEDEEDDEFYEAFDAFLAYSQQCKKST